MLAVKQLADLLTLSRALLIIPLVWIGLFEKEYGLLAAVLLLLFSWVSDVLDGPIARRSREKSQTWIGDHDLEADILVSVGLLVFKLLGGYLPLWIGACYALLWSINFLRIGTQRTLGMLLQAPINAFFIIITLQYEPEAGSWLVGVILLVLIGTWPRFPNEVLPDFLAEMRENLFKR